MGSKYNKKKRIIKMQKEGERGRVSAVRKRRVRYTYVGFET